MKYGVFELKNVLFVTTYFDVFEFLGLVGPVNFTRSRGPGRTKFEVSSGRAAKISKIWNLSYELDLIM